MDKNKFKAWLAAAQPGEEIVYHTGSLMFDRQRTDEIGTKLDALADCVFAAHKHGDAIVFQRAIEPGKFNYLVRKVA